ncbi:aspartate carbamoyltransferase regulatory chain [Candidatus Methanoplasma termitum]|uniref:Aspartate carbamoyltransferase regulatory chain n=1 Tax=Candidatus Methanoplasma termitum TaxID=1577791 RepID=A0A0A7LED1_9ARCH|nr:aspartate carbamoyltransferase regulatory subunit [Candidatus Methanoplasma termitum]AIZ56642.1 aspartate carbamoyltransferase regulatory chain [Candidatus Methanoplasma termitum]MCL2333863.1 aspartate carbamoyltransferase regulatory subunit [Candidatus Methanoplasma sp.]
MDNKIVETKIPPIRNGTVIDHIANGQSLNVLKILGVNEHNIDSVISIGMHVPSSKTGWKDVIKVEDRELDPSKVGKIALIAPDATISIIRDYYVAEKFRVNLDDHIVGLAKCSNPNCITNRGEPVVPEFHVEVRNPPKLRCVYCDRILTNISDNLL